MKKFTLIISSLAFSASVLSAGADLASLLVPLEDTAMRDGSIPAQALENSAPSQPEALAQPDGADAAIYVDLAALLPDLRKIMEAQFAPEGGLTVEVVQPWKSVRVNDADWHLQLLRVSGQALASRTVVSFRILCGDVVQGDYQLQLVCTLKRDVLVSRRYYNRGEAVNPADFEIQVRDVLDMPVVPIFADSDLSGYDTRGAVAAGQVIFWRDVQARPLMRRGQVVEAVASDGLLRIAVKALVMEDGRAGDMISVRNLSSNKDIQARILDERTVQVYF
ncbi:MAG: flagellar basal body P-ring formation chaperone FlgA [Opitutales bacterium]|jgi:flagella basal body P-ring formation protein FlgA